MMNLDELEDIKLISLYGDLIRELKSRKIIRTKNIVGEIGEHLVINYYTETKGLPRLQEVPVSTNNIDAISDKGERYTIKTVTGKTTGVFYGLNHIEDKSPQKQMFEYVIVVILDEYYDLKMILELNWDQFLKFKKWHSRMAAWNITINKELINESRQIFSKELIKS